MAHTAPGHLSNVADIHKSALAINVVLPSSSVNSREPSGLQTKLMPGQYVP